MSEKKRDQLPDFSNNGANNDVKAHEKEKRKMKKKLEENEEEVRKLFRELDHAEKRRRRGASKGTRARVERLVRLKLDLLTSQIQVVDKI